MSATPTGGVASPYDVLGIERGADDDEIIAAYRARVKEAHPDHDGSVREFRRVQEAYEAIIEDGDWEQTQDGSDSDRTVPQVFTVEYLDYKVLADFGWNLDDEDLFSKAAAADLPREAHGHIEVEPGDTLLEAAEKSDLTWPFACRGGACSNCAVALIEGKMPPPVSHVLTDEMIDLGIRLSCSVAPVTDNAKVVFNVKHLPLVEELTLPASRFGQPYPAND